MGFQKEELSYVTTDWDKNIDYLDSIELFNILFSFTVSLAIDTGEEG